MISVNCLQTKIHQYRLLFNFMLPRVLILPEEILTKLVCFFSYSLLVECPLRSLTIGAGMDTIATMESNREVYHFKISSECVVNIELRKFH